MANKNYQKSNIFYIVSFIFLINAIFLLVCYKYGFQRSVINIDYLLLILFFYKRNFIGNTLLFIFLSLFLFIEQLLIVLQVFPFIQLNNLFYLSSFIFSGPALYQVLFFSSIIFILTSFFIVRDFFGKRININKNHIWASLFIFTAIATTQSFVPQKIITSQTIFFIKNSQSNLLTITNKKPIEDLTTEYAGRPLYDSVLNQQPISDKILFVVSESWGETARPNQQQAILKPIYDKKDKLQFIEQGSFPFVGATVMGEFRELCKKKLMVMDSKNIPPHEFEQCLPNLLKQQGYTTHSIYGADDRLYSPNYWYPLAGLDNRHFVDDLPNGGQCMSFDGRCDVQLLSYVKNALQSSDKSFVYWLTLNSHAPYDDKIFIDGIDCQSVGLKDSTQSCNNYRLHYQFFHTLSQLIDDENMKGLEVYVVGDHAPPLTNLKEGLTAFKGVDVAWLHFKIKEN